MITSLASGSLPFTVANTDTTSFDIFNTRVSGTPAKRITLNIKIEIKRYVHHESECTEGMNEEAA